jgi:hypothetical protein
MNEQTHNTIKFTTLVVAVVAVMITFIFTVSLDLRASKLLQFTTANRCIDAGGTWIPSRDNLGSCVINHH